MKKEEMTGTFDFYDEAVVEKDVSVLHQSAQNKLKVPMNKSNLFKKNSLVGKCLVYIGNDGNELYDKSVIYITECTADIVRGIMINKLLFGTATLECKTKESDKVLRQVYEDLYQGGPENPAHGYVLFPKNEVTDKDPFAEIHDNIAVSTSFGVLQDILDGEGPSKKIIAMGHCVWHRGELEWEIFNNQWLIVPSDEAMMFDTALENRWQKAYEMSGVQLGTLIGQIGLA